MINSSVCLQESVPKGRCISKEMAYTVYTFLIGQMQIQISLIPATLLLNSSWVPYILKKYAHLFQSKGWFTNAIYLLF